MPGSSIASRRSGRRPCGCELTRRGAARWCRGSEAQTHVSWHVTEWVLGHVMCAGAAGGEREARES
eukprot:475315-Rhodomonas_salina.1